MSKKTTTQHRALTYAIKRVIILYKHNFHSKIRRFSLKNGIYVPRSVSFPKSKFSDITRVDVKHLERKKRVVVVKREIQKGMFFFFAVTS